MIKTRAGQVVGTKMGATATASEPDDDGAFSVREFCQRYDVGHTQVYAEINSGRLIAKKRGTRTLIPRANARAWFSALPDFQGNQAA